MMHNVNVPAFLNHVWNHGDAFLFEDTVYMVIEIPADRDPDHNMRAVDLRNGAIRAFTYGDGFTALRLTINAEPLDHRALDSVIRPMLLQKNRVGAIKALREHTGWGLKEAHLYCKQSPLWGDY